MSTKRTKWFFKFKIQEVSLGHYKVWFAPLGSQRWQKLPTQRGATYVCHDEFIAIGKAAQDLRGLKYEGRLTYERARR